MWTKCFSPAGSRDITAIPTESRMRKARTIPIFSCADRRGNPGRNSGMIFNLTDNALLTLSQRRDSDREHLVFMRIKPICRTEVRRYESQEQVPADLATPDSLWIGA